MSGAPNDVVSVLVVEDHEVLSQSLVVALRNEGFEVAIPSSHVHDDVVAPAASMREPVVPLDLHLGEGDHQPRHDRTADGSGCVGDRADGIVRIG